MWRQRLSGIVQFGTKSSTSNYWQELAPIVASIGRWILNLDNGICQIDETLRDLIGWNDVDLKFPAIKFLKQIHPNDLPIVLSAMQATINTGDLLKTHFRFVRFDGSIVWLDGRGAIVDYEDGCRYLTGVNFDVSEYKF